MLELFILRDKQVCSATQAEWIQFMEQADARKVAGTELAGFIVSTVFLGLHYSFEVGPPVVWETRIFSLGTPADLDDFADWDCKRCSGSWEQAEEIHARMVAKLREALGGDMTS